MAHFAELDSNNIVARVVVISDEFELDGETWCHNFFEGGTWVQTSYNGNIRKNYAGIGDTYDTTRDAFIAPQPYPYCVLDEDTCRYEEPVAYPTDGTIDKRYTWNESNTSWVEITE